MSLKCHLGIWSCFIANNLFMWDSSCWPISLIGHKHIVRCLIAGKICRWYCSKHFSVHAVRVIVISPKSAVMYHLRAVYLLVVEGPVLVVSAIVFVRADCGFWIRVLISDIKAHAVIFNMADGFSCQSPFLVVLIWLVAVHHKSLIWKSVTKDMWSSLL